MAIPYMSLSYTHINLTSRKQIRRQEAKQNQTKTKQNKKPKQTNKQTNKKQKHTHKKSPKIIKMNQELYLAIRLDLNSFLKCLVVFFSVRILVMS